MGYGLNDFWKRLAQVKADGVRRIEEDSFASFDTEVSGASHDGLKGTFDGLPTSFDTEQSADRLCNAANRLIRHVKRPPARLFISSQISAKRR